MDIETPVANSGPTEATIWTFLDSCTERCRKDDNFAVVFTTILSFLIIFALALTGTGVFIICYHMLRWAAIVP